VAGLEKGLQVIATFDQERSRLSIAEVAARTGLTRAAARRYLITLTHLGYMRHENKLFSLTPMVLRLGQSYLHSARPAASGAAAAVPAGLCAGRGGLGRRARPRPTGVRGGGQRRATGVGDLQPGTRVPAWCTANGRMLLASLPPAQLDAYLERVQLEPITEHSIIDKKRLADAIHRARSQGYALVDQELELGLRTMAVP
jgi:IclR family pca regulon transcriptional regulator